MRDDRDERVRSDTTTTEERVEMRGPGDPVAPPLGEPEVEQAVVRENEVVRQREDGTIERDTVREERRRTSRGSQIGLVLRDRLSVSATGWPPETGVIQTALGAMFPNKEPDATKSRLPET